MKKIVLLVVVAIMAFSLGVKAQTKFANFGKPKKEVVKNTKMGENVFCTSNSIIKLLSCKVFIDGKYAQYWVIGKSSLKDYRKDIIGYKMKYGEPVVYWADDSKVKTFKQAITLSEDMITVKFNEKKEGVYRIVQLNLNDYGTGGTQAEIVEPNNVDYFSEYNGNPIMKNLKIRLHRINVKGEIKKSFKGW